MDQIPALPQGIPVFWGTMFVLLNVAVSLFCAYVVPAYQKLREGKLGEKKYSDDRADKGFQFVISQLNQDKEAMAAVIEEKETDNKNVNEKFTEAVRLAERYKTQWENSDIEIKRLRDQDEKKTIEITELRKEIERIKDHERATKAQTEENRRGIEKLQQSRPDDEK